MIDINNKEIVSDGRLSDLKRGELAQIIGISPKCKGDPRKRLLDLGFVRGTDISVQNVSPMGNPIAYNIRNTLIALRNEQANLIFIKKVGKIDEQFL